MNVRKTLARAIALALLAPASVAVVAGSAAPAHAATQTLTTTATLQPVSGTVEYGSSGLTLYGAVKDSTGSSVYDGTVTLQASPYPFTSWTGVATSSASGFVPFEVKPTITTHYRLVYGGSTAATSFDNTYRASTGAAISVPVARKLTIKHKGLRMWGKIAPASKTKIVFKQLKHKKLKKWFKVKTNKKGKWSKHVNGKVGTRFVVILPATAGYAGQSAPYRITGF